MPRCIMATLTVDRPRAQMLALTIDWLNAQAQAIEDKSNDFTTGTYTARRISADGEGTTMAKLKVHSLGYLSLPTRRRIAKWLRSRASYLSKYADAAVTSRRGWFRQDFTL